MTFACGSLSFHMDQYVKVFDAPAAAGVVEVLLEQAVIPVAATMAAAVTAMFRL
ncbi:hypothetical protein [Catenulispora yoronensis]